MNVPKPSTSGQEKTNRAAGPSNADATQRQAGVAARCAALTLVLIGLVGLADFGEAWIGGGLPRWNDAEDVSFPWLRNGALLLAFGLQHSGMARNAWKRHLPERWNRAINVATSGVASSLLVRLWTHLRGDSWWDGAAWLTAPSVVAVLGILLCFARFDPMEFLGLRPFWPRSSPRLDTLDTSGPYRFVRHPLMLCTLVFLWSRPTMTATQGWLAAGLSVYIVVGSLLEERDLARRFGATYAAFRRRTPMLLPWRLPRP